MKPEDVAVWGRFIAKNPGLFESCDYDMALGVGAPVDPNHPEEIQRDHTILTQKKVDVVAYRLDQVTLIEVKPIADMRAMGQIMTYHHLYTQAHPEQTNVWKMVVCGKVERELAEIFANNGILIRVA